MKDIGVQFMKLLGLLLTTFLLAQAVSTKVVAAIGDINTEVIRNIPMQDGGRLKPFDTFARETMTLVYGKSSFNGRAAHEVVFTWFYLPKVWASKKIVQMKHRQLKETLKLSIEENLFSPNDLLGNERLSLVFQELAGKLDRKEKLDPYYQSVQRLQNQLSLFKGIITGLVFRLVPPKSGNTWLSPGDKEFPEEVGEKFKDFSQALISAISQGLKEDNADKKIAAEKNLEKSVSKLISSARAQNPELYPELSVTAVEVHYNKLNPFMWAWIIYLLAVLLLSFAWYSGGSQSYKISWILFIAGFLMHSYGFALRVYIADRPPVSNMYETVVWVSWGGLLFAAIIEAIYKQRFILLAGGIGATFCLILASIAPSVLDPSISPLQPVLVSNFWLLIHVLVITISYSAFLLAFVLGDVGIGLALINETKHKIKIRGIAQAIYRAIQIGVVLLATGIILGGIWADYSWGRFWGWDPKETWALIALLGYIAMLHGRLVGWLRDFGMVAGAVVAFSLIIMAWYGVNFVLGAGLHSYGFGGGGIEYVASFVGIHFVYVLYATMSRQKKLLTE